MTWGILDVTWAIINIATAAVFMFIINANLAMIVILMLPVLIVIAIRFRTRILYHYRRSRKMNSKITGAYNEGITGVRVIKALSREDDNLEEFSELTDGMYEASFKAAWLSALFLPTVQIISAVGLSIVLWRAGMQVQIGNMTIGGIQAFVSYITFIMWPIQDMARVYAQMQNAVASAERIFNLIDTEPDVKNRSRTLDTDNIQGDIRFENVHFHYEKDDPVIQGLNFHVKHGEKKRRLSISCAVFMNPHKARSTSIISTIGI